MSLQVRLNNLVECSDGYPPSRPRLSGRRSLLPQTFNQQNLIASIYIVILYLIVRNATFKFHRDGYPLSDEHFVCSLR